MKTYANRMGWSDIEPFEVIEQKTECLLVIREMEYKETEESIKKRNQSFVPGGFFGHFDNDLQDWEIKPKEGGYTIKIRKHKDGCFYDTCGHRYTLSDKPIRFYDFNF